MKNLIPVLTIFLLLTIGGCKEDETNIVTGFNTDKVSLTEGVAKNNQVITVTLVGSLASAIKVPYTVKEGTAKAGVDITTAAGELEFSKGVLSAELPVEILGDTYFELGESFDIVLTYNGTEFVTTLEITNDDAIENILTADDGFYTPDNYPSMQAAFKDEFDGTALNTTQWTYELGNGCSVGICGWNSATANW